MGEILKVKNENGEWIGIPAIQGPPGADGAQGPAGADGIQGPPGPNEISGETATALTGIIKGDGSAVTTATPGEDYAAGKHAPQHAADGADPLTPGMIGALEYDDISGRSASGTFPRFDSVFPGTEMEHTVLYGKSTQDGTPSPDAPVEIVDFAPGSVAVNGKNFACLDNPGFSLDVADTLVLPNGIRMTANSSPHNGRCFARYTLPSSLKGKTVTVRGKSTKAESMMQIGYTNHGEDVWSVVKGIIISPEGGISSFTIPQSHTQYNDVSMTLYAKPMAANESCDFTDIMIVVGEYTAESMPSYQPYTGATYPVSLTLRGIPVDEGGNYTDETGQQYIADTYDVMTGEYVQRVGVINSYASEAIETPYMSTTGDLTAGAHVLYALADPIVTRLDPQQVLAYSPTTQISAGGGYIGAKLGAAMAPVRTTPQELTQAQISQAKVNLDIPDRFREGRALPLTWAEVSQMCELGDYKGIREGDYIDITLSGTFYDAAADADKTMSSAVFRMEIAGIDSYYQYGDTAVPHHIDFISRDCYATALSYNATATNSGAYLGSALFTTLNGSRGIVSLLPADVAAVIISKRGLTETKTAADATGWVWNDMGKLWLPTEQEVWGHVTWAEHKYGGGLSVHYPIFQHGLRHIIKGAGHGGGRVGWWCASSVAGSAAGFCAVYGIGTPTYASAATASVRVPLCFRVAGLSAQAAQTD